jgi:hypothetical protein
MSTNTVFFGWANHDYVSEQDDTHDIEIDVKAAIIVAASKDPTATLINALNECGWNVPEVEDVIAALEKMQVQS